MLPQFFVRLRFSQQAPPSMIFRQKCYARTMVKLAMSSSRYQPNNGDNKQLQIKYSGYENILILLWTLGFYAIYCTNRMRKE